MEGAGGGALDVLDEMDVDEWGEGNGKDVELLWVAFETCVRNLAVRMFLHSPPIRRALCAVFEVVLELSRAMHHWVRSVLHPALADATLQRTCEHKEYKEHKEHTRKQTFIPLHACMLAFFSLISPQIVKHICN